MNDGREHISTRRDGARPLLFISYRRRFDAPYARLLKDGLTRAGFEVFRDVEDIEPGAAFPDTIRAAVEGCDAFLLLVSPGWVEVMEELRSPEDFVRREVAGALARRVSLVPVLLGGARMPEANGLPEEIRDLAFRQAIELSDDRWDYDVGRLVNLIRAHAEPHGSPSFLGNIADGARSFFGARLGKAALLLAVVAAAAALAAPALRRAVLRYERRSNFEGCVSFYAPDVPGGAAQIGPGQYDVPVVTADRYKLATARRDESGGVHLVVTLTDAGKAFGAVFLRFQRADATDESSFTVERVVAPPCEEVQDYRNDSRPAGDRHRLKNWDTLRVSLGGRDYYLRTGDHGDYVSATLTTTPRD